VSPPQERISDLVTSVPMPRPAFARLAAVALKTRFGLDGRWGLLRLLAAAIDPFIYATILYFLLAGVFGRSGFDRYVFLVVGISALRWTVVSLLDGADFAVLRARFAEVVRAPGAAALCAVVAPPSVVMALSLAVVVATVLAVDTGPAASLTALPWLALVLPVQAAWNAVAVLLLAGLKAAHVVAGPGPFVLLAGVLWLLSPTLYTFTDLPAAASLLFTTLNPVSHLLAAYYNSLWYGVSPSLDVLPAAGAAALVLLAILSWRRQRQLSRIEAPVGNPLLIVAEAADTALTFPAAIVRTAPLYRPWSGRLQGLSGRHLAELMIAASGRTPVATAVERVAAESRLGQLFDDQVAIYPSWGMAQLAYGFAIASPARTLVLDGVLDGADPMFAAQAWARIAAEAAAGRRIVVVTYRLFAPPAGGGGRFVAVRGGTVLQEGEIGAELAAFYGEMIELGGLPDPSDDD
jgi:ABC-type polysaccharide/polyol phosphate export permease